MNPPLVAVFMVTYNHENYIAQAIDSVLMQKTTFPIKLFIGEDCSTDQTAAICLKYKQDNPDIIEVIFNKQNLGAVNNAKQIFGACFSSEAKYIAMLEGDDYWTDPYKLQKQADFMESYPNYAMLHTNKAILHNNKLYTDNSLQIKSGFIFEELMFVPLICTLTVLIKTDILRNSFARFNFLIESRKWLMGDFPLWLDIAQNYEIAYLNNVTGVYRFLDESASHSKSIVKAYHFEHSVINIKEYFYEIYTKSNKKISLRFKLRFSEMIFHERKRLVRDYRWKAKEELTSIIFTNPLLYVYFIFNKILRILKIK